MMFAVTFVTFLLLAHSTLASTVSNNGHAILRPVLSRRCSCHNAMSQKDGHVIEASSDQKSTLFQEHIKPHRSISLHYASYFSSSEVTPEAQLPISAEITADMKLPSVLLEEVPFLENVDCSASGVSVKFSSVDSYRSSFMLWPRNSSFLLFTNHLGDCDEDNERGVYFVSSLKFDNSTHTVTASTKRAMLQDYASNVIIDFNTTAQAEPLASVNSTDINKRASRSISKTLSVDLARDLYVQDNLKISAEKASLSSALTLSGHVDYNFLLFKLKECYIDLDLDLKTELQLSAQAGIALNTELYSYKPSALTVSAFSIPGIIHVGPMLQFAVGVEFATNAKVRATVGAVAEIQKGHVHLDLLKAQRTSTSGWKPVTSSSAELSANAEVQLNPYVSTGVAVGVNVFSGLVDLSAGIEAKATVLNTFAIEGQFKWNSVTGVSIPLPQNGVCTNGAWFGSAFSFGIDAYVSPFFRTDLYDFNTPIIQSKCWSWASRSV